MKRIFREIRHVLGSFASTDGEVQLMETLEALDNLETDFAILCQEVARLSYEPGLSGHFSEMLKRREIKLP